MVNNAGIAVEARDPQPIHTTTEETWDLTMRVNAKSVFLGCKYAVTQMLAQEPHSSGDRGWIINISSIYGLVGGANNRECTLLQRTCAPADNVSIKASYCASKGAVANLTRNVAMDYSSHLIHCNAICPGRECFLPHLILQTVATWLMRTQMLRQRSSLKLHRT
jgi:NAD(P)-dependent dehydrogenase (short-subunit alcohol dehydrogenase family)